MMREYVPALYTDNRIMMKNDPAYADRLAGMGDEKLVDAYLRGSWDLAVDGMFAETWQPAIHIIDQVHVPASWRIDRGFDYGSSAPAGALYFAESNGEEVIVDGVKKMLPPRSLIVISEVYFANEKYEGLNMTPESMADVLVKFEFSAKIRPRVRPGPADAAIFEAQPGFESISDKMERSGIHFTRSDKSGGSRKRGVQFIKQMLNAARVGSTVSPHLYVVRSCKHLIRTLPNLPKDPDDMDDVDSASEDHLFDVLRYRVLKAKSTAAKVAVKGH
jgi:hypothetical protein